MGSNYYESEIIKVRDFMIELEKNHLMDPLRVTSNEECVCIIFHKNNILAYLELYHDGDMGIIAEDRIKRCTIENIDIKNNAEAILVLKRILE